MTGFHQRLDVKNNVNNYFTMIYMKSANTDTSPPKPSVIRSKENWIFVQNVRKIKCSNHIQSEQAATDFNVRVVLGNNCSTIRRFISSVPQREPIAALSNKPNLHPNLFNILCPF